MVAMALVGGQKWVECICLLVLILAMFDSIHWGNSNDR